jgi:hypothetical protein
MSPMSYSRRFPLAPTPSRKRERARAPYFIGAAETSAAAAANALLPLAREGGAKRRMRASRGAGFGAIYAGLA